MKAKGKERDEKEKEAKKEKEKEECALRKGRLELLEEEIRVLSIDKFILKHDIKQMNLPGSTS